MVAGTSDALVGRVLRVSGALAAVFAVAGLPAVGDSLARPALGVTFLLVVAAVGVGQILVAAKLADDPGPRRTAIGLSVAAGVLTLATLVGPVVNGWIVLRLVRSGRSA